MRCLLGDHREMAGDMCGLESIGGKSRDIVCEATRPEIIIWEYLLIRQKAQGQLWSTDIKRLKRKMIKSCIFFRTFCYISLCLLKEDTEPN